jgi:fermentation-respiration switch protein FrsA (DUF1100 family)
MRIVGMATTAYGIASLAAAGFLVRLALHPARRPVTVSLQAAEDLPGQDVTMSARDGARLHAWYIPASHPNGAAVILLHGMADNREGVAGFAGMFLRHGYAVLLPDSRAQGESGGPIPTYGVLEREDVRRWAAWVHARVSGCEYLFGESMGAAIAIQASAVTPRICAVAAESTFSTFREIANDRIAQNTGLGLWFSETIGAFPRELALLYVDLRYRVDLTSANPLRAIQASHVPTLLICGTADDNIPMRHSLALYRAGRSHSELWIVEGAQHTGAQAVDPQEFESRVVGWFGTHATPQ